MGKVIEHTEEVMDKNGHSASYISVNLTVRVNPTKRESQRAKLETYFLECIY